MTPREANVLLTRAALLDSRLRREPEDRADMARAWAEVLLDVRLEAALAAVVTHYREQTRSIMPADVVALVEDSPAATSVAPADATDWLSARGVDPREFDALLAAGVRPARALRELGVEGSA